MAGRLSNILPSLLGLLITDQILQAKDICNLDLFLIYRDRER